MPAPDEILPEPEAMPETVPEGPTLRHPGLPANHFRNIIDPDSPLDPGAQVDAYRRANPRLFRR
jgi:hypothetical protein